MKRAVYAGTFDPVTFGHLSVIERAAELFDRLEVVIAENPAKAPCFSLEQRLVFLRDAVRNLANVDVFHTAGFVVQYAQQRGARFLVRGVRGATDADYEAELAAINRKLAAEIQTVFLPAHAELSKLSSSALKALAARGEDTSSYTTALVASALRALSEETKGTQHVGL